MKITDQGLKSLSENLKTLTSLQSLNLSFSSWVAFAIFVYELVHTAAPKSQIQAWKTLANFSKHSTPYILFICASKSKWLFFQKLLLTCLQQW